MKTSFKFLVILIIAILACEGPEGEPGAPGIKGDKGDKGEKGDQGVKGENGLSPLMFAFKTAPDDWKIGEIGRINKQNAPGLTAGMMEKDLVLAFFRIIDFPYEGYLYPWQSIPYMSNYVDFDEFITFNGKDNEVEFFYDFYNPGGGGEGFTKIIDFNLELRIIVISSQQAFKIKTDYKNYNELKAAFQLPD